jgi:hypothetical protein
MLKGKIGNTIILGIDAENVKRLKENRPIFVNGSELDIPMDICIMYGDTLKEVADSLNISLGAQEKPADN